MLPDPDSPPPKKKKFIHILFLYSNQTVRVPLNQISNIKDLKFSSLNFSYAYDTLKS